MVEIAAAIAAYMVGMPALVFTGARKLRFEECHLAGRRLNLILLTGTFCATVIGRTCNGRYGRTWIQQGPSRSLVNALGHGRPYGSIHTPS